VVRSALNPERDSEGGATLVIAGPTAAGKSALAVQLAAAGGAVVCADSRQVYETMCIGTASPDQNERAAALHVGYNLVPPEDGYDAGRFLTDTDRYVRDQHAAGRSAVLVGGAGLYLRSWRFGLGDVPGRDEAVRARLEDEVKSAGSPALHARLAAADPEAAARIEPEDFIRVVRALEILEVTGQRPSALRRTDWSAPPRVVARWILLDADGEWLRPRLVERVRQMFQAGLVEEALALRARLGAGHRLLETMGYQEAIAVADGGVAEEAAIEAIARRQWQYARRQRTWFKKEPWWERFDAALGTAAIASRLGAS